MDFVEDECPLICGLFDDFGGWFPGAVSGFGFDADQDRVGAGMAFLESGGVFETVSRDNPIVRVRG